VAPKVSVVLNCYNHEPYVAEAIESVLNQTFRDFELIIIDNGSTDATRSVIERYDDPRIRRVLHDENQSLSKRLNEGVAMARGEFVAVLYSDDYMLPDKLERQVRLFAELPADYGVVYCPALGLNHWTGERWQLPSMAISGPMLPAMLRHHFAGAVDMGSPLTRRECFERYRWHEDLFGDGEAIFFRIGMRWKFHFDPQPTVVLRDHGGNLGKAIHRNHTFMMEVLDRLAAHPDFNPKLLTEMDGFRARLFRNHAWAMLRMGSNDSGWIRQKLAASVRLRPAQLLHPRMLASLALVSVPSNVRVRLNSIANSIKGVRGNAQVADTYAGK
jgi:glycosyltransferase involved in cell wall biosynthesis